MAGPLRRTRAEGEEETGECGSAECQRLLLTRRPQAGDTKLPMSILTRHVLAELAKHFLVSLAALTLLMILVGMASEALKQSIPPAQVVRMVPYILPEALRVAVPVALLLATTNVFGRLSDGNEIVALKSLGISPMTVIHPVLVVSFFLSLGTVWLNDLAVSWGRAGVQRVVIEAVEEIAYSMLRTQRGYQAAGFAINVKDVDGRRLLQPRLTIRGGGSTPTITITAEEAELESDLDNSLLKILLRNGTLDVEGRVQMRFLDTHEQEIPLREASRGGMLAQRPSEIALRDIPHHLAAAEDEDLRHRQTIAARAAYQMLAGDFDGLSAGEWRSQAARLEHRRELIGRLRTEPHRRWSAGFSCLFFAIVGAPMAITLRNRGGLTKFFLCFAPILVVYYPLLAASINSAKAGTLPPASVWVGNLALLLWGAWLIRRVLRY